MEAKLKEEDQEIEEKYENFDTDEDQPKKNNKKINYLPIFLFITLITLVSFLLYFSGDFIKANKSPKKPTYELSSKCLTTTENMECKTCSPGDKLQDGKCLINHSFKAIYHTDSPNSKVKLFDLPKGVILEMAVNDTKIEPTVSYSFKQSGDHTLYVLVDMNRIYTLGGMFLGCKQLISIEFSPLFNTERVNEMNFMFQNCESLKSIDVSVFNTHQVAFMEYMFSGCSSLTSLNLLNFDTQNVEKMNSVFQGCSSLKSIDLHTWNTKSLKNI